jgi:16S rRNA (uracil1498-N3)-methyltransferase
MPTFFVGPDAITPPTIRITGDLLHHLRDSLRLHPGDSLTLNDACGTRYQVEVTGVTAQIIESRIVETLTAPARVSPSISLAQALLKGEKMDWVIQKAAELGVDSIFPVNTKHGVVKIHPDRLGRQRTRWQRIALEAAQQSERWTVPTIAEPDDLSQLAMVYPPSAAKFILMERSASPSLSIVPLPTGPDQTVAILIGPEGGWDQEEQQRVLEQGFTAVTLGTRILRAETAAIAALSIVQSRLGELG